MSLIAKKEEWNSMNMALSLHNLCIDTRLEATLWACKTSFNWREEWRSIGIMLLSVDEMEVEEPWQKEYHHYHCKE